MEVRDVHALLGRTAYDVDGDRLGTITGAYLDNATGRPSWMTVERGGLFRSTRSFVPVDGVEVVDGGVRVAVASDAVRQAPHVDDDRALSPTDERELLRHYGLDREPGDATPDDSTVDDSAPDATPDPTPDPTPDAAVAAEAVVDPEPAGAPEVGHDLDDGAMTRSEERARVGTTTVPTARAVLRTTRVVEDRTFSVPLGRDQVQVAYEPLPDAGPAPVSAEPRSEPRTDPLTEPRTGQRTGSTPGIPSDADDEGWVVLYEERLVVRTEWVPVERVRLRTAGVRGEEVVQVDLRREQIDVDVEPVRPPGQEDGGRS